MTWDEVLRSFWYGVLFPGFGYLSMVAWNQKQRKRSIMYGLLSMFFLLLLAGLVLLRFYTPSRPLLYINTGVITAIGIVVLMQCWSYAHDWWSDRHAGQTIGEGV